MTERHWPPVEFAPVSLPEPIKVTSLAITITTGAMLRSMYDETGTTWIVVADLDPHTTRLPTRFALDEVWVTDAGEIIPVGPILWEWLTEQTDTNIHLLTELDEAARAHTEATP